MDNIIEMSKEFDLISNSFDEWGAHTDGHTVDKFIAEIFDITTYDSGLDAFFVRKFIDASDAILNKTTFDYIKTEDNYRWFIAVCNMPFIADRIDWGTSIRGCWFDGDGKPFDCCCLWRDGEQIMNYKPDNFEAFIAALILFFRRSHEQ